MYRVGNFSFQRYFESKKILMFDNLTAGPETGASSSPMSQISIVFTGGRHENPAGSLNEIPIITATQK